MEFSIEWIPVTCENIIHAEKIEGKIREGQRKGGITKKKKQRDKIED